MEYVWPIYATRKLRFGESNPCNISIICFDFYHKRVIAIKPQKHIFKFCPTFNLFSNFTKSTKVHVFATFLCYSLAYVNIYTNIVYIEFKNHYQTQRILDKKVKEVRVREIYSRSVYWFSFKRNLRPIWTKATLAWIY